MSLNLEPSGYRLSVVGCRLSVIGYRLSVIGYRLSVIGYRLSVIGYRLSVIGCRLSVIGYRLSVISYRFQVLPNSLIAFSLIAFFLLTTHDSRFTFLVGFEPELHCLHLLVRFKDLILQTVLKTDESLEDFRITDRKDLRSEDPGIPCRI